ncbi:hypothetical protein GFD17_01345 [Bifidobacterium sp. SMB2]|uniref:Uncharacterized protein n=1 Tax=Bifidobacterium saimiriisciurei TaxID=2661627 RepID=A0ABX0CC21_9BIFI|nr:hypothetical protein [Bifidobacterium sp. SMB2]NEH11395.1 hypothetical protein [Bifidobacterium saimiriisciurei]
MGSGTAVGAGTGCAGAGTGCAGAGAGTGDDAGVFGAGAGAALVPDAVFEFAGCVNAWPQFMQNPESSCRGEPHFGQNLTGRLLPLISFLSIPLVAAKLLRRHTRRPSLTGSHGIP